MEKKRYQITLDRAQVEEAKRLLKALGLPQSSFSAMLNDGLPGIVKMLTKLNDRKQSGEQFTFQELLSDTLTMMGDSLKRDD